MVQRIASFSLVFILIGLLFSFVTASRGWAADATEQSVGAELVWSQSDGLRHEIFSSSFCAGEWTEPQQITDDNADNLHPSIDIGPDGRKWVAWTALEESGMELRYSHHDGDRWQPPALIPSDLASNIKPSIMVAEDGVVWVAWSANDGGLDDIYYSRFLNGEWGDARPIHEPNQVPDILPLLGLDETGTPLVMWQRYQNGGYVQVESIWEGSAWGEPTDFSQEDELTDEQDVLAQSLTLPDFVIDIRQIFVKFIEESPEEPDCTVITR